MVSVMLYPCISCVALLMDLFVLCVYYYKSTELVSLYTLDIGL